MRSMEMFTWSFFVLWSTMEGLRSFYFNIILSLRYKPGKEKGDIDEVKEFASLFRLH